MSLKDIIAQKRKEKSDLTKQLRKMRKEKASPEDLIRLENRVKKLTDLINRFKPSNTEPRYVDGLLINYKLYQRYIKKLKGFSIRHEILPDKLLIYYHDGSTRGKLELFDLSGPLEGLSDFPKGELSNGETKA
ncbi:hypothetical protein [Oceanobacillus neutriphilus]|uniref:Uncharacterized protein n=1 Tax=Oceanobacillus neutriphilus TaxID=531815 RepID=A0ABQ2NPD3_9BACI|nr:hypothetical protein [Oceanobacillus neutriphilus]GGP07316.1 hypothetical protein GCM10011346_02820 [Oceanobacillus neutriphilus]